MNPNFKYVNHQTKQLYYGQTIKGLTGLADGWERYLGDYETISQYEQIFKAPFKGNKQYMVVCDTFHGGSIKHEKLLVEGNTQKECRNLLQKLGFKAFFNCKKPSIFIKKLGGYSYQANLSRRQSTLAYIGNDIKFTKDLYKSYKD